MDTWIQRLAKEPPFRIFTRAVLKHLPVSARTRARWELSSRPQYLVGLLEAAEQALRQGVREFAAIEFGVAGGTGLRILEQEAASVERETGIAIKVYGFDNGSAGLPDFIGDYRDHPDEWRPGDYPMDEDALRAQLTSRTHLVIGNVRHTVPAFVEARTNPPVGFVSIDLDLYSSTTDALRVLSLPGTKTLKRVVLYFDDIMGVHTHRFGGERLAIDEFNGQNKLVKIDHWYGLRIGRPFPERGFLDQMYIAHNLDAINKTVLDRAPGHLRLD